MDASLIARSSCSSVKPRAMSTIVHAGVVTGTPLYSVVSILTRRCTVMPDRRGCLVPFVTDTWIGPLWRGLISQCSAELSWLSTAPGWHARTAAMK